MNSRSALLIRASLLQLSVTVVSVAIAIVGLIGIPVADAVQAVAAPSVPAARGLQIGHSSGRIEKIDIERAAVTLKHGPIVALGMPDMTMVFRVADLRQLAGLHVGDQVRFEVRNVKGALVIFRIDRAP